MSKASQRDRLTALKRDPAAFRKVLVVEDSAGKPRRLGEIVDEWQHRDFEAMDAAWRRVAGQDVDAPIRRAWMERPRGHSKTSDQAVSVLWALFASNRLIRGAAVAADQAQAGLLRDAIARLVKLNPWIAQLIDVQQWRVVNRETGSELNVVSSDISSSYGWLLDFAILDEVSHWAGDGEMFESLLSTAAKRPHCLLQVITNAGFKTGKSGWVWEVREGIRSDSMWYFHALDGPLASWITQETIDEQRRRIRVKARFERLFLNRWLDGSGDAIDSDDIAAALTLASPAGPEKHLRYLAGLDLGVSRDASAFVVLGVDAGRTEELYKPPRAASDTQRLLAAMNGRIFEDEAEYIHVPGTGRLRLAEIHVWKPTSTRKVDLQAVEETIADASNRYNLASIAADAWQAELLCQRLQSRGVPVEPIAFSSPMLQAMASATLDVFRERQVDLCDHPDLLADIRSMRITETRTGYRLEAPRQALSEGEAGTRHGDAGTAFALCCYLSRRLRLTPSCTPGPLVCWPE